MFTAHARPSLCRLRLRSRSAPSWSWRRASRQRRAPRGRAGGLCHDLGAHFLSGRCSPHLARMLWSLTQAPRNNELGSCLAERYPGALEAARSLQLKHRGAPAAHALPGCEPAHLAASGAAAAHADGPQPHRLVVLGWIEPSEVHIVVVERVASRAQAATCIERFAPPRLPPVAQFKVTQCRAALLG